MMNEFEKHVGPIELEENHLVIESNTVLSKNAEKCLNVTTKEEKNKVIVKLVVKKNCVVKNPISLCFGVLKKDTIQNLDIELVFEKNSSATLLAHCVFPNGYNITHNMDAKVLLQENSSCTYKEVHYHGEEGKIIVNPYARIVLEKNSSYRNEFKLLKGKAGKVNFDYEVLCKDDTTAELTAIVNAKSNDIINIKEKAVLEGKNSSSVLISKIVLNEESQGNVYNEILGIGDYSKGHVDCTEILTSKKAIAKATPIVDARNNTSNITHEAAIGGVNKDSLNTLMSRGLDKEESIKIIINGLLK